MLILSFLGTGILRRYAFSVQLLDIPNHRSSHTIPTPRGGGIAFVICFLLLVILLSYVQIISSSLGFILGGCGVSIAYLGFLDDKKHIPAKWRLAGHFLASIIVIYCSHQIPALTFFKWTLEPGLISSILGVFYLVWLINLYNFMDGIDGIAAIEAIFVCLAMSLIYYLQNLYAPIYLPLGLALAVSGFLLWNFPPARIFMGDAGSGFLGLVIGVFSIQALQINPIYFWGWIILLGVFIVDATITLLQRAVNKEKLQEAHCTHAYQQASLFFNSHCKVTLWVLTINIGWLLPMSLLVTSRIIDGFLGVVISYLPLIFLAIKFNAGKKISF